MNWTLLLLSVLESSDISTIIVAALGLLSTFVTCFFAFKQTKTKTRVDAIEVDFKSEKTKNKVMEEKIKRLEERVSHDAHLLAGMDKRFEIQQDKIDMLTTQIESYKKQLEKERKENNKLRTRIKQLETQLAEMKRQQANTKT